MWGVDETKAYCPDLVTLTVFCHNTQTRLITLRYRNHTTDNASMYPHVSPEIA